MKSILRRQRRLRLQALPQLRLFTRRQLRLRELPRSHGHQVLPLNRRLAQDRPWMWRTYQRRRRRQRRQRRRRRQRGVEEDR